MVHRPLALAIARVPPLVPQGVPWRALAKPLMLCWSMCMCMPCRSLNPNAPLPASREFARGNTCALSPSPMPHVPPPGIQCFNDPFAAMRYAAELGYAVIAQKYIEKPLLVRGRKVWSRPLPRTVQ